MITISTTYIYYLNRAYIAVISNLILAEFCTEISPGGGSVQKDDRMTPLSTFP
jgi:hypothetical protein